MHHRELSSPAGLHPSPGFSHVAIASGTKVVHFAGQVALAPDFALVGEDDLEAQTRAAMENLKVAMFPPRARFFSRSWGTSRFPTPLRTHEPEGGS